jgi:hypothetical protein
MNHIAEGEQAEVLLGPVRALPVVGNVLTNPVLRINGEAVSLPVEIASGCRVEIDGDAGVLYDARGERVRTFCLDRALPPLITGANTLELCLDSSRARPRARLSLVCRDPRPLGD